MNRLAPRHITWDLIKFSVNIKFIGNITSRFKFNEGGMRKKRGAFYKIPDSNIHGANMGPTWVLSAPNGPHVGPTKLAI